MLSFQLLNGYKRIHLAVATIKELVQAGSATPTESEQSGKGTGFTDAPSAKASSTIRRFSSNDRYRRFVATS